MAQHNNGYSQKPFYSSQPAKDKASRMQLDMFPDATVLAYGAILKSCPNANLASNQTDFNLDETPLRGHRPPGYAVMNDNSIVSKTHLDKFEENTRDYQGEVSEQMKRDKTFDNAPPHPINMWMVWDQFEHDDEFRCASQSRCSDYTSTIELLRCENWAFNRLTLNPQMSRYKMYPALNINLMETDNLKVSFLCPDFNADHYDAHHHRGDFNYSTLPPEVNWTIKDVNNFTTNFMLWPRRDTARHDHHKEYEDFVVNREFTEFHDLSIGPHYDMAAETLSPYIPHVGMTLMPHMAMGHLSLSSPPNCDHALACSI